MTTAPFLLYLCPARLNAAPRYVDLADEQGYTADIRRR